MVNGPALGRICTCREHLSPWQVLYLSHPCNLRFVAVATLAALAVAA